jgi:hypothetical protein
MKLPTRKALVRYLHWRENVLATMKWIIQRQNEEIAFLKRQIKR